MADSLVIDPHKGLFLPDAPRGKLNLKPFLPYGIAALLLVITRIEPVKSLFAKKLAILVVTFGVDKAAHRFAPLYIPGTLFIIAAIQNLI